MDDLAEVANQSRTTISIGERDFDMPIYGTKEEFLFIAVQEAFTEIDALKKQNRILNDKLNSFIKVK